MKEINTHTFLDASLTILRNIEETQSENIKAAAEICAESIKNGGVIQVFGSGHSIGFGFEMKKDPGSLFPVHSIVTADFVKEGMYTYEEFTDWDNIFERRPGIAQKFYDLYDIHPEDVFIIISNSGINGLVIDLAMEASRRGQKIIVVTSLDHTLNEDSRHPSKKKLMDFGDVVIDNCGPLGDAMLDTEDGGKIGSISSIAGITIAQGIVVETTHLLHKENLEVPIIKVEDSEEARAFNEKYREKYRGRI